MTTTKIKPPYMICYFNSTEHQHLCGITEREFDVIEKMIRDEYGNGYAYKQPVHNWSKGNHGLIGFGITQYGKDLCFERLKTWTALNGNLHDPIWEKIRDKQNMQEIMQEEM